MWKAISTASPSWVGEGKNARVIQKGRVLQARVALGGAIALSRDADSLRRHYREAGEEMSSPHCPTPSTL